jgi:DNA-binding MarR family transcriptional regulator
MSGAARRQVCNDTAVDYGLLDELLGYAIARANLVADATFHAAVRDRSVTPLRYAVLEVVDRNPGLQQVQLAEALALSRSAVTLLLDFWQAQGCVERRPAPMDRRSFGIFLTTVGMSRLRDLQIRAKAHDEDLCAPLTATERIALKGLLNKLDQGRIRYMP